MMQDLSPPPAVTRFSDLLKCPGCLQPSAFVAARSGYACRSCDRRFSIRGGVLDLVGGTSDTALDVAHYDQQKGVDLDLSRAVFAHLKEASEGAIKNDLGTVLEIGA